MCGLFVSALLVIPRQHFRALGPHRSQLVVLKVKMATASDAPAASEVSDPSSAAVKVFNIVELVGAILVREEVPIRQLYVLQRISTTFRYTLATSLALRFRMWLDRPQLEDLTSVQLNPLLVKGLEQLSMFKAFDIELDDKTRIDEEPDRDELIYVGCINHEFDGSYYDVLEAFMENADGPWEDMIVPEGPFTAHWSSVVRPGAKFSSCNQIELDGDATLEMIVEELRSDFHRTYEHRKNEISTRLAR